MNLKSKRNELSIYVNDELDSKHSLDCKVHKIRKMTFLQIKNSSNRCWKAKEQLIYNRKLSLKWLFSVSRIAGSRNKTWGFGWGHFKTQRKRIITVQTNKWRSLVNDHTSGATC